MYLAKVDYKHIFQAEYGRSVGDKQGLRHPSVCFLLHSSGFRHSLGHEATKKERVKTVYLKFK